MIGGPNPSLANLAALYNSNNIRIAESLSRIASGKRIQVPSDDFAGYARASGLSSDVTEYQVIKQDLQDAKGFAEYAAGVGNDIISDFTRLKELKTLYDGATGDAVKQAAYRAEYDATIERIDQTKDNSYFDTVQVYQQGVTLKSVEINPDNALLKVTITASKIANEDAVSNIAAGGVAAAIQSEINNAQTYAAEMESFSTVLSRDINLAETVINSKEATISVISGVDDVAEMTALTAMQIRQQATAAMLAQANVIQGYAAKLYGG